MIKALIKHEPMPKAPKWHVWVKPILPMPNLPVARVMWKAFPDLTTGVECWIAAGGAHHTVLSYDVTAEQMKDWRGN